MLMEIARNWGEREQAIGGAMILLHWVLGHFAVFSKQLFFR